MADQPYRGRHRREPRITRLVAFSIGLVAGSAYATSVAVFTSRWPW